MEKLDLEYIEQFSELYDNWLMYLQDFSKMACIVNAKLAHEIKNPLTLMRTTLQLIEYHHPDVKGHKYWHTLYEHIDHISDILTDFTSMHKSELIEYELISICEVLEDIKDNFEPMAIENKIILDIEIPDDMPRIHGNKQRLYEAFINIVKNAFEATNELGYILIIPIVNEDKIVIHVKDNGIGIKEEHIKEIFSPFVTFKEKGTGLGLPIVKTIIEEHLGKISVNSIVNVGTTFTVELPVIKQTSMKVI